MLRRGEIEQQGPERWRRGKKRAGRSKTQDSYTWFSDSFQLALFLKRTCLVWWIKRGFSWNQCLCTPSRVSELLNRHRRVSSTNWPLRWMCEGLGFPVVVSGWKLGTVSSSCCQLSRSSSTSENFNRKRNNWFLMWLHVFQSVSPHLKKCLWGHLVAPPTLVPFLLWWDSPDGLLHHNDDSRDRHLQGEDTALKPSQSYSLCPSCPAAAKWKVTAKLLLQRIFKSSLQNFPWICFSLFIWPFS